MASKTTSVTGLLPAFTQKNPHLLLLLNNTKPILEGLYEGLGAHSPNVRHFVHVFQKSLDAVGSELTIDLDFNQEKGESATRQEKERTPEEETAFKELLKKLKNETRQVSNTDHFAHDVAEKMERLCNLFEKGLNHFHEQKWAWQEGLRQVSIVHLKKKSGHQSGASLVKISS
jgi:hypothetical protein